MSGITLLWFKRDLRVTDHPALVRAAGFGDPVLPIYVIEPDYWALEDTSARQWAFAAESLTELRGELAALGAPLVVRQGDVVEVFGRAQRCFGISRIVSHEETGNAWTFARDRRVGAWARAQGIVWEELPQSGVVRRLRGRDGWARQRDGFMAAAQEAPVALSAVDVDPGAIPELSLAPDPCPDRQTGGRAQALFLLGGFLKERGRTYRRDMSSPAAGAWACSRLSPHLAFGTLSAREAEHAARARAVEVKGTREGWGGAIKSFRSRLAWRDHFMQKLEDEPGLEHRCLHRAYEGLRGSDAARLHAWEMGETGLPFVDACMRYIRAGGWLNFRMRSMVAAVGSYHLWLDWRSTGPILARYFTDYEPGIHWSQMQMQSGTTGMNTVRVYNPVKQGLDQDPDGVFTRHWVPELAQVPDAYLQEPWLWEGAGSVLGRAYPAPLVDVKEAAKQAREVIWGLRKGDAFRTEAAKIVHKHASRKDRQRRFVRDVQPKPDRQLKLDL